MGMDHSTVLISLGTTEEQAASHGEFPPRLALCQPERTSLMTCKRRDQSFTQRDVTRAKKAAIAAGDPNARIEIDTVHRTITIIPGEHPKAAVPEAELTPLDQWRANRSGQG